ncbi:serine hydrolase domain-containing protein [Listeria booriae]|uniref:Beta-lactamase family protein n=1 Tax=Listeria booriae TaxID=1552123 RepID=A0A7X1DK91_9LIST|nr:serine hydrolase domain-containing protein [Listeria booriae]MBC2305014.1 beta-lactamase family protein [Listeria booriae]MBC2310229.1 beta-lactamase family protein [Listeria booriae]
MHMSRAEKARKKRHKRRLGTIATVITCLLVVGVGGSYAFVQMHPKVTANEITMNDESTTSRKANIVVDPHASTKAKIEATLKANQFNGTAYIVKDNQVILNQGLGIANKTLGKMIDDKSLYIIGSMQKAVVATAIMQLQEKGLLNVEDPINKYFPDFPNGKNIKIKNFLGHTSGINGRKKGNQPITSEQILRDIEAGGIYRQPGKWDYRDDNYAVMGRLIEVLTNQTLTNYLKQHIFTPARMTQTGIGDGFFTNPKEAVSYKLSNGTLIKNPYLQDNSQLFGAGNMYMPPKDIYLFDKALTSGKLISQASLTRMLQPGAGDYGFGFYDRNTFYISRGVIYNYETINSFSKDHKDAVILFSNIRSEKGNATLTKEIYGLLQ